MCTGTMIYPDLILAETIADQVRHVAYSACNHFAGSTATLTTVFLVCCITSRAVCKIMMAAMPAADVLHSFSLCRCSAITSIATDAQSLHQRHHCPGAGKSGDIVLLDLFQQGIYTGMLLRCKVLHIGLSDFTTALRYRYTLPRIKICQGRQVLFDTCVDTLAFASIGGSLLSHIFRGDWAAHLHTQFHFLVLHASQPRLWVVCATLPLLIRDLMYLVLHHQLCTNSFALWIRCRHENLLLPCLPNVLALPSVDNIFCVAGCA